jgi:F-type H+-transporting ATPase subunit epsilon
MALELVVVTPEGEAFAGTVDQVVLPGVEGEFGVLESHERFLSALEHGCMEIRTGEGSHFSAVSDGFAEVTGERVVVMVDGVVDAENIDLAEVRADQQRLSSELESLGSDADGARQADLQDALARANAQLDAVERHSGR